MVTQKRADEFVIFVLAATTMAAEIPERGRIKGIEKYTIGLSPSYWSHVPVFICQVLNLRLVEGITCVALENNSFVPMSKCTLIGTVIAVDRKSNGSIVYVIDDGTGLIDCLYWLENGVYEFPSLTDEILDDIVEIGTPVRVLGKIEPTYIHNETADGLIYCIPEIHASIIEPIPATRGKRWNIDFEGQHISDCMQAFSKYTSATDVLDMLGPVIGRQVSARENLPTNDDELASFKVFGINCKCDLPYKETLLYCHCKATMDSLDPNFVYRDRLLEKLLTEEAKIEQKDVPFRFVYNEIVRDEALSKVAREIVKDTNALAVNEKRLVTNTFRALRDDGVLFLLDNKTDTYLFISRERVLEPYVKLTKSKDLENILERSNLKKNQPPYLSRVPRSRLQYVGRTLDEL